jgi:small subunit ribosomal protein S2
MKQITLEELLEAGCHFGHQVTRSNPKARDFVFENRDNIQIIDLVKTKEGLDAAIDFVRKLGERGGSLLVVGTKRQARPIIDAEIIRVKELLKDDKTDSINKLFYITQRWIGGIMTNFTEVSKNFQKLVDLKANLASAEEKAKFTKKEVGQWEKERQRLDSFYSGLWQMKGKPDALFIVDSHLENLAVREALAVNVPTVAIVDTNADPFVITHPIPANDDAVGSIKLIVAAIMDAWTEGIKNQKPAKAETKVEVPAGEKPKVSEEPKVEKKAKVEVQKTEEKKETKSKVKVQKSKVKVKAKK